MEDVHDTCFARLFQNSNTINVSGVLVLSPMMILKKLIFCIVCFVFHISFSFIFHYVLQVLFWKISIPFNRKPFSQKKKCFCFCCSWKTRPPKQTWNHRKMKKKLKYYLKTIEKAKRFKQFFLVFFLFLRRLGMKHYNVKQHPCEAKWIKIK